MSRTLVIAEIGSCHDGDLTKAKRLIDAAKKAGADVAKVQYWSSAERLAERRRAPDYREIYAKYQVPREWLPILRAHADAVGIGFACTVYLPEDVWAVAEHADIIKVASFEANDPVLLVALRPALAAGKRIIVSLGMNGSRTEVGHWLVSGSLSANGLVKCLHCVSSYPTPVEDAALGRLRQDSFFRPQVAFDGYSDHTGQSFVGALAVAAGAQIIEAHLKLYDTDRSNPDAGAHAHTPGMFASYVTNIRYAESALGEPSATGPQPCEAEMAKHRVTA